MTMSHPPPSPYSHSLYCSSKSSSKSPLQSPYYLHHQPPKFTPIRETEELDDGDEAISVNHTPMPLHQSAKQIRNPPENKNRTTGDDEGGVSCTKCLPKPKPRDRISVVPLVKETSSSMASPSLIFRSICSSKSPAMVKESSNEDPREEQRRIALTELSQKLVHATRKRDEAVLEASRIKHTITELETKLCKLERYCHGLKSNLELSNASPRKRDNQTDMISRDKVVESFLLAISESRSSVRVLSKALTLQLRQTGGKLNDKISLHLQPYDVKLTSLSRNPKTLLSHLEALLNRAFYKDFESVGFEKSSRNQILNPIDRCQSNYASFTVLNKLTWEEVLSKGTKHFSEPFSRFCDRKMSEVVPMLGLNRACSESLLQAFFGASKSVWLVHLLANSVYPSLPIFRVDPESRFDSVYMADLGADRAGKLVPTVVRVMVAPGFYVFSNVVKCKVLCRYVAEPKQVIN